MKTAEEWNKKILEITLAIQNQFPELSKYIAEMPVTMPDEKHPEITLKNLSTYYESLENLLNKYSLNHDKDEHQ
jgi:hypothetical protein